LIPFGPSGRQAVSEAELFNIVTLKEKSDRAQSMIDLIAARVVDLLKAGAQPEDACLFSARLEVIESAGITEERLLINGVCRWRRVSGSDTAIRRQTHILATEPL
jgi:hypothetical protein